MFISFQYLTSTTESNHSHLSSRLHQPIFQTEVLLELAIIFYFPGTGSILLTQRQKQVILKSEIICKWKMPAQTARNINDEYVNQF